MSPVRRAGLAALAAAAAMGSVAVGAQQIYRIVGPDGRVTFSDKPPVEATARATAAPSVAIPAASTGPTLPFELRAVATRYPVVLYTSRDCGPCTSGRSYLANRGVPFTERTISTEADVEALKRIAGAAALPVLTVGGQQLKGFSDMEWTQYLDAAGYPKTSQLPGSWRNPAPAPLVAAQTPPRVVEQEGGGAGAPRADAQPAPAPFSPAPLPPNPAGIRF